MKKPIFSIIIPVRQTNPYLQETIDCLKKQTVKNFETLIITDKISGSANPSEKRNIGAQKAKGDYLVFFDDDSFPSKNYFKNAQKLIQKYPQYAAFCGPCLTPPQDDIYRQASGLVWSSWLGSGGAGVYRNSKQSSRFVDDYPSVNLIVKKTDFFLAGQFNDKFWPGEDTVLCLNITKRLHLKIYYHPTIIVYHHRRPVLIHHLQQITRYAIQRGFFAKKFPQTSLRIGYLLPSLFVIYLILLIINYLIFNYYLLYVPLFLYLSILLITFLNFIFKTKNLKLSFISTVSIPMTHIYYGILFQYGLFKKEVQFKAHKINPKNGQYIGG
ncbi:MAG: glycosyltransferase [Candidatus Shapirobacteria bacterium]|nr:glycosyltransferase [Candidatus Shapirobacteria bacterium]